MLKYLWGFARRKRHTNGFMAFGSQHRVREKCKKLARRYVQRETTELFNIRVIIDVLQVLPVLRDGVQHLSDLRHEHHLLWTTCSTKCSRTWNSWILNATKTQDFHIKTQNSFNSVSSFPWEIFYHEGWNFQYIHLHNLSRCQWLQQIPNKTTIHIDSVKRRLKLTCVDCYFTALQRKQQNTQHNNNPNMTQTQCKHQNPQTTPAWGNKRGRCQLGVSPLDVTCPITFRNSRTICSVGKILLWTGPRRGGNTACGPGSAAASETRRSGAGRCRWCRGPPLGTAKASDSKLSHMGLRPGAPVGRGSKNTSRPIIQNKKEITKKKPPHQDVRVGKEGSLETEGGN